MASRNHSSKSIDEKIKATQQRLKRLEIRKKIADLKAEIKASK